MGLFRLIGTLLTPLRLLLVAVLGIGLPLFLYLYFAREPVFEPVHDVDLGRQTVAAIAADPEQFPVLSEAEYPEAYAHLQRIVSQLLSSPEIAYRELFAYDQVKIIHDDETLNAFCTPGGFIYVYSGLIRYLEAEDHLAGVLGHEVAHAERRHSSLRLQKEFGANRLFEFIVLANPISVSGAINLAILKQLTSLSYSRDQEAESDDLSVRYLASTDYACDGAAGFFAKLLDAEGHVEIPAFLSDHPDSASRVRDIRAAAQELGCSTTPGDPTSWQSFQDSLPAVN